MKIKLYIAKPNTWFDAGTICLKICDVTPQSALFVGNRTAGYPSESGHPVGYKYLDEEDCNYDEFDVIEQEIQ